MNFVTYVRLAFLSTNLLLVSTTATQNASTTNDPGSNCAVGAVASADGLHCSECSTGTDDDCYAGTACVYDAETRDKTCTCRDGFLVLKENADAACGFCESDDDCPLNRACVSYSGREKICAVRCLNDSECTSSVDPHTECQVPHVMSPGVGPLRRPGEGEAVCWCQTGLYRTPEGLCARKPNVTEEPIECYSCSNTDSSDSGDCMGPPFKATQICEQDEICFTTVDIAPTDWKEHSVINEGVALQFTRAVVTRGCLKPSNTLVYNQQLLLASDPSLWQNCKLVNGFESGVTCEWTCDSPLCNWQTPHPVVQGPIRPPDHTLALTIAGIVLILLLILMILLFFKLVEHNMNDMDRRPFNDNSEGTSE